LRPGGEQAELQFNFVISRNSEFLPRPVSPGDVLAVMSVDQLRYDSAWSLDSTSHLVGELHAALFQLVRGSDQLGQPWGNVLVLALKRTDASEALDLCAAMTSHLQNLLDDRGEDSLQSGRISTALAVCDESSGPLGALLAALNALRRIQCSPDTRQPVWAKAGDVIDLLCSAMDQSLVQLGPVAAVSETGPAFQAVPVPRTGALETDIDGYVEDNMEGAIDQAVFLSHVDIPIAIVGASGTGKLYIAKTVHREAGGLPEDVSDIDCREFRGRRAALRRIAAELDGGEGKTLVFKSPHQMHPEAQRKLARQISSRVLADTDPPRYLPAMRLIALFPDNIDHLMLHGGLEPALAGVFAGYPIYVPALRDRDRAVLRWAHKILVQESAARDRQMKGFTPDAEQVLQHHSWPGNISEMRRVIAAALDNTDRPWITPVDLGLFAGVGERSVPGKSEPGIYLSLAEEEPADGYQSTLQEQVSVALGKALESNLKMDQVKPLGSWLDDEVVLAACEKFRGDVPEAARLLQTRSRNIARWMPSILSRDYERNSSLLWQEPRKLVRSWILDSEVMESPPQQFMQDMLMGHVIRQCEALGVRQRAELMGVSAPTYTKRLQEWKSRQWREDEPNEAGKI
jgi:DNA-binding NtrC family response regulator